MSLPENINIATEMKNLQDEEKAVLAEKIA
jgi:hypothetical protein